MAAQTLPNTKNDLISAIVLRELGAAVNLLPTITDYSALVGKGMKSVSFPKLDSFTVQDRTFGAAGSEQTLTDSKDTINLDKNKLVLFARDISDEVQSTIDFLIEGVKRASSAHGRQIDADIIAALNAAAGLNINAGVPAAITADNILEMREFLMNGNADMSQVVLAVSPAEEKSMLLLPEFSRYDYRGVGNEPVFSGMIGAVYGVPVIINNQIGAQQAYMYEKGGVGFAFQKSPAVDTQKDVKYGVGGELVAVDALYGVAALSLGVNGVGASESPLIAKLAN